MSNCNHDLPRYIINFHGHSKYSVADSIADIEEAAKILKANQVPAMCLSEHGHLCSSFELSETAKKYGLQPIYAMEAYYADFATKETERKSQHILLVVKNEEGWKNMLKLNDYSVRSVKEGGGYFYRPRIDEKTLFENSKGLIVSSACIQGILCSHLHKEEYDLALFKTKMFKDALGDDFYIELQPHNLDLQAKLNRQLIELAHKFDVKMITTIDSHYNRPEQHVPWMCNNGLRFVNSGASSKAKSAEEWEERFPDPDLLSFKSTEDILESYTKQGLYSEFKTEIEQSIKETHNIFSQIDFDLKIEGGLPHIEGDSNAKIREICLKALKTKFNNDKKYVDRFEFEYKEIVAKSFGDYFMILWDLYQYAEKQKILTNFGRGSAAGCLILYLLGCTKVDPVRYNLPFERFSNPERESLVDVDCDFPSYAREEIINYLRNKYGEDRVVGVISYSKKKAKSTIKDVSKYYEVPFDEINNLTKTLGFKVEDEETGEDEELKVDHLKEMPEFKSFFAKYPNVYNASSEIEGSIRQNTKHAAGICILPKPYREFLPVYKVSSTICTAFEKTQLERIGLYKFDILGLSTLDLLKNLQEELEKNGEIIDVMSIAEDPTDEKTFEYMSMCQNLYGIFQFDSHVQKKLMKEIPPDKFIDLVNLTSLGRPQCLNNKDNLVFADVKAGRKEPKYPFKIPVVEKILNETNGVILFQEQIMKIGEALGISLGSSDLLRKNYEKAGAISKRTQKVLDEISKTHEKLEESAEKIGIPRKEVKLLTEWLMERASYSFGQAHACLSANTVIF